MFKLAVVVVIVALAGPGLAFPKLTEVGFSENESFAIEALSSFIQSDLSFAGGIKNCISTGAKIVDTYGTRVRLSLKSFGARVSLFGSVVKCFFKTDRLELYQCGVAAFEKYAKQTSAIQQEKEKNRLDLEYLLKYFPKCLKEDIPLRPTAAALHN